MTKKCAPVIIATLNRSEHFIRLMESLRRNSWAQYTDVYVGLDYPPSEEYVSGYNKICQYLTGNFSDFANLYVIKRNVNYGGIKNFADLRDFVLGKYDRFIRVDDDAEFSPNFLEYINKCLDKYEHDEDVIAVTGYSYPIKWKASDGSNVLKVNFNCSMWGTGFWKDKYLPIIKYIESSGLLTISSQIKDGALHRMIDIAKYECVNLCLVRENAHNLIVKMSDISLRLYLALMNSYVIIPRISKVRNWGFDGSGVYCPEVTKRKGRLLASNYDYKSQEIDSESSFVICEDTLNDLKTNRRTLNRFDALPLKYRLRLYIKLVLLKFLGVNNYIKLFS